MYMEKRELLRIGIIGAGDIVRKAYIPIFSLLPGLNLVGIYNRTLQPAEEVASLLRIGFHTNNLNDLLEQRLDAAFVLTANDSHYELCKKLLENQVDVYVEKPAATDSQRAQILADLAERERRIFMVGYNRRYAPLYRQAKEIFGDRKIRMCILEKHRASIWDRDLEESYLDDIIHQIDLLRFFTGEPVAKETRAIIEDGTFRGAVSTVGLISGGIGMVISSREAGMWQERAILTGEELTVIVHAFRELHVLFKDHEEVYGTERGGRWFPQLQERGFTGEVKHFLDCVRSRSRPQTDGYDSVKTQKLMEDLVAKTINQPA